MKKYYLRLYKGMENQPTSQASADARNKVIMDCLKELQDQGLNIEALPCGSKQLVVYDEYCIPLKNSSVARFFSTAKIKFNRTVWEVQSYLHNKKMERKRIKAEEEFNLSFIDFKYKVRGTVAGGVIALGDDNPEREVYSRKEKDGSLHVSYNGLQYRLTKHGVELWFRDKPYIVQYSHFDIPEEFLQGEGLC